MAWVAYFHHEFEYTSKVKWCHFNGPVLFLKKWILLQTFLIPLVWKTYILFLDMVDSTWGQCHESWTGQSVRPLQLGPAFPTHLETMKTCWSYQTVENQPKSGNPVNRRPGETTSQLDFSKKEGISNRMGLVMAFFSGAGKLTFSVSPVPPSWLRHWRVQSSSHSLTPVPRHRKGLD